MKRRTGQGLIEYMLIFTLIVLCVIVIVLLFVSVSSPLPCEKPRPTAGDIVSCIATRTAEARYR